MRATLKEKLEEMVRNEVIVPVTEPPQWVNSLTAVIKKNNSLRVCLDSRPLNKAILREHFAQPTREELMSQFAGAQWFSKIDANSALWQIELDDESSFLTTFHTPFGRFRFLRLPYDICSAGEVFQRVLYEMFNGIHVVVLQMVDLVVYGSTRAEHGS